MLGGINPPAPAAVDGDATYRGAFEFGSQRWTDGWTVFSLAGMN
jgi:hypothetical protein